MTNGKWKMRNKNYYSNRGNNFSYIISYFPFSIFHFPFVIAISLGWALLAGCGGSRSNKIVVGSKNFTEQAILGELLAHQVEKATGLPVERKLFLGGTLICHNALVAGELDMYVEYTGTAFTVI